MKFMVALLLLFTFLTATQGDYAPKTWVVNLDKPPAERWPFAEMAPIYNESISAAVNLISVFIPKILDPLAEQLAIEVLPYLGEYAEEIKAGSQTLGIELGTAVLLNIIYEVEAGCTSIVAQDGVGNIFHGRNLDFNLADVLRKLTIRVEFQSGGKTLYYGTTYAGYVGLLTGMRPGSFAISCDERVTGYLLENLLEALFVPGTTTAAFLVRSTLATINDYETAVEILADTSLAAPIYIIVSGTKPGQGSVITRDRSEAADIWNLDVNNNRWYLVETNYDHWLPAGDQRRQTAMNGMNAIGQNSISLNGLFNVLSTSPVENGATTYTTLTSAASGNYSVLVREPKKF